MTARKHTRKWIERRIAFLAKKIAALQSELAKMPKEKADDGVPGQSPSRIVRWCAELLDSA